jgi:hypothetical protein
MTSTRRQAQVAAVGALLALAPVLGVSAAQAARRGPINARLAVNAHGSVSATITVAKGGRLTVRAAHGTRITVTFPKGAVYADTLVTATPVTKLASAKLHGGLLAGVQLRPEGLQLHTPATVRFARHARAPRGTTMTFVGSLGNGRDVYRLPPAVRTVGRGAHRRVVPITSASVSIMHFSTTEAFDWSNATIAEIDAINLPGLGANQLAQELAQLFREHASISEVLDVLERARVRYIEPLLTTAAAKLSGAACSQASIRFGLHALRTAAQFNRQVQLLDDSQVTVDADGLLTNIATCLTGLCQKLGDPRVGPYFLLLAHQIRLMGLSNNGEFFAALYENMVRCGKYELHLDSRIDQTLAPAQYSVRVDGRAKVTPIGVGGAPPPARGPITYTATSGATTGACETIEISSTTDGEFELALVSLGFYDPENPTADPQISITITLPTLPMETLHERYAPTEPTCEPGPAAPDQRTTLWAFGFQAEHPVFTFSGKDWARAPAPVFAIAVYSPAEPVQSQLWTVTENTLVEIISTPDPPRPLPDP